uniref:Uncharacterized protein n=1 Tax=Oryza brachyantha TaxID=4533 RepID=J3N0J5_ORYBR
MATLPWSLINCFGLFCELSLKWICDNFYFWYGLQTLNLQNLRNKFHSTLELTCNCYEFS